MIVKQRKCKHCREKYTPVRPLQTACSPDCAIALMESAKKKAQRIKDAKRRDELKSRGELARDAQTAFNKYIRLRDGNDPCISCGRYHEGQYHAGHYLSVGARPELRFEELNVHKQCAPCNNHLSGNIVNYRRNLIEKIGVEKVEWLEGKHEQKKYSKEDLREIRKVYLLKLKELERGNHE